MRHTWKETLSGLKRNLTMTIAVIVTMAVSLTLFGVGILSAEQVDLARNKWYDKIHINVFLCTKVSKAATCDPGQDATDAQKKAVNEALRSNPQVDEINFQTREAAYKIYRNVFKDSPYRDLVTAERMAESYQVKLKDPEKYQTVRSSVDGLKGVEYVQDLQKLLEETFKWLNLAKWATIAAASLLLLAAALQIVNTIRMTAFARRRELGIMRLVGASNFYIVLPFLLESLIAGLIGVLLAGTAMATMVYFVVIQKAQVLSKTSAWIGWKETGIAIAWVALVGVLLSIVPTLIATRKYLRV